jgi:hypothetical protein
VRICGEVLQDVKNVNILYVQLCHNFYQLVDQLINYSETDGIALTIYRKGSSDFVRVQVDGLNFAREDKERGLEVFLPVFFEQLDGGSIGCWSEIRP